MSSELVATVYNNCVYAGHHVDPTTHAKTGKQVFVMMSTMKAANGTTTTTIRCFEHPGGHDGHGAHNKRIQLNGGIKALEIDSEIKALCDAQLLEADCKGRMKWVIRSIIQGSIKAKTYTLEQLRQPGCFKQQQGASHILPKSDPLVENPGRLANPPPEPRGRSSTNPVPTEMPAAKHVVETTENEDGVNIKAKEISGPSTDGRRDDVNDTAGINTGSGSTNGDQGAHDAIKHVGTEAAGKDVVATSSTSGTAIAGETGEAKAKATKKRKANPEDYPKYREAMAKFREDAARRFCQRRSTSMHNHNDIFATALDLREHDRLAHHDLRLPHDYCFDIATDHMGLSEESGFMGFRDEILARRTDLLLMICDCFCISTGLS